MNRLEFLQDKNDGTFDFSYDFSDGRLGEPLIRTGAIGWLVWGMCYYLLKSGNRSSAYLNMVSKAGSWILSQQVKNDTNRNGLLQFGYGRYVNGAYTDAPIDWCSTEHQCSALQALQGVYLLTGQHEYANAAQAVKNWLNPNSSPNLYDNANNRYKQGYEDYEWALDCTTWAGATALNLLKNNTAAAACRNTANSISNFLVQNKIIEKSTGTNNYNQTYELNPGTSVDGFKPYKNSGGYIGTPEMVWTEGTLGYAYLCMLLGENAEAKKYVDEVIKLQNCNASGGRNIKGIIYASQTSIDLDFHVWESVVSSAWLYLLVKNPEAIFPGYLVNSQKSLSFTINHAFFEKWNSGNFLQGEIYTTNYVAISIETDDSLITPLPTLYYPQKNFDCETFAIPVRENVSHVNLRITHNYRYHRWKTIGGTITEETKDVICVNSLNLDNNGQVTDNINLHDERQSSSYINFSMSIN
ncbi:MAG: hypothetical protein LBV26_08290 [Bacteroidales bacterium]|jgi:hypothetical protein|nr:hypothetical protein [Bacteroidales bacterium]